MSGTIKRLDANGSQFKSGSYAFDKWPGKLPSGFNYYGTLKDTKADGHSVKVHGKVDGYGYAKAVTLKKCNGKTKYVAQKVYGSDPAEQGKVQVCTVRSLLPDYCKESPWYYR